MNMTLDPAITVAFSGHRASKIFPQKQDYQLTEKIYDQIYETIMDLYAKGYRNFITGMAPGFDLWAGHVVMLLKALPPYQDMKLIAAIPYDGQRAECSDIEKKIYDKLTDAADRKEILFLQKCPGCYYRRNDWMLDHSGLVVCYYKWKSGGTHYTITKAIGQGHKIVNLYGGTN